LIVFVTRRLSAGGGGGEEGEGRMGGGAREGTGKDAWKGERGRRF